MRRDERRNIVSAAMVVAEANQRDFLPSLPHLPREELTIIAREYKLLHGAKVPSKDTLVQLLTESINSRVAETREAYSQLEKEEKQ